MWASSLTKPLTTLHFLPSGAVGSVSGSISLVVAQGWLNFFNEPKGGEEEIKKTFDKLDIYHDGSVDLVDWTCSMTLIDMSEVVNTAVSVLVRDLVCIQMVKECKEHGPLYDAALDEEELELMK